MKKTIHRILTICFIITVFSVFETSAQIFTSNSNNHFWKGKTELSFLFNSNNGFIGKTDLSFSTTATFTVMNLNDSGAGSLRQAILDANAAPGNDVINFQSGLTGIITLTSGELSITSNITINGSSETGLIVERNSAVETPEFRIFNVAANTNVQIRNITIRGGRVTLESREGGGIYNAGTLNLENVIVRGNRAGHSIPNFGQVTFSGGGIYNSGQLSIVSSTISENEVGFISFSNQISSYGGGIANTTSGTMTLTNTEISRNWASGSMGLNTGGFARSSGISNGGTATLINCIVTANRASARGAESGGIGNSGTLTATNTIISNNHAFGDAGIGSGAGGGIGNHGTLNLANSTISGNSATGEPTISDGGGGIFSTGSTTLINVTIAENKATRGGGIRGEFKIKNSIIADNSSTSTISTSPNVSGTVTSEGHNLISNKAGSSGWIGSDLLDIPAKLAPLGFYGGFIQTYAPTSTQTHALLSDSPAINAGDNTNVLATDQRGVARIINGVVDIGAFEFNVSVLPNSLPNGSVGVSYNQTLSASRLDNFSTPFNFTLIDGSLPNGLTLSQNGSISGSPTATGTYTFTVKATGSDGMAGAQKYTLTVANCSFTLTYSSASEYFPPTGGTGSVFVNSTSSCAFTAQSNAQWITITSGSSGTGSGTVQFSVQPNNGSARSGTITIAGRTFTVNQASGCTFGLTLTSMTLPATGGNGSFNVTTNSACTWTAVSNAAWISITSGTSGTGNGTVSFTVAANSGSTRTGTITIGGQVFTVTQQSTNCNINLSPASPQSFMAAGGNGTINVSAPAGCTWGAISNDPSMILITGGTTGNGNGVISFAVLPNSSGSPRSSGITIGQQFYAINQAGQSCNYTISPTLTSVSAEGIQNGSFTVTTNAGCEWTAVSDRTWVTTSSSGNGNGTVNFTVAVNNTKSTRVATITVAGQVFTIHQAALRPTMFDFDGDKKTDISVYRPLDTVWHLLRSQAGYTSIPFGLASDKLAPADYDGDKRTDIAVFRESNGKWYILQSSNQGFVELPAFGQTGDIPVVGDWDGDDKADVAVYREGANPGDQSYFYFRGTLNNPDGIITFIPFGQNGDVPVMGDFDGDGKQDPVIFRPSVGEWWYLRSSDGANRAFQFGQNGDKPLSGDFTGDGRTDITIWRPSTGEWFILRSEDFSYYAAPFGSNGDIPVVGDYDGDAMADIAVWRPSDGNWYIVKSSGGFTIAPFGKEGDKPIPSAFVH